MTNPRPAIPDAHQRLQIAAKARVTPETVLRCYKRKPVRSTVAARIREACAELELPQPEAVIAP
jgi:DNA-binding LacI/PurR family transcriptional regulator